MLALLTDLTDFWGDRLVCLSFSNGDRGGGTPKTSDCLAPTVLEPPQKLSTISGRHDQRFVTTDTAQPKCNQNATETQPKRNRNATDRNNWQ
ncbi:MAG: hypothetical protein EA001_04800 [Oscillatoriales cyanobacterium]|nr:MAG: hypothetical protein EA001_04800 [Oscillatoriales cyanobacterium]